jgi:copper chaperone CopZ
MRLLLFVSLALGMIACSQSSNKESEFYVRGNCDMCKERIENAAKAKPGVVSASWNVETSQLRVSYDSLKTKELEIHQAVAATGHGTKQVEMNEEAHKELPECCRISEP